MKHIIDKKYSNLQDTFRKTTVWEGYICNFLWNQGFWDLNNKKQVVFDTTLTLDSTQKNCCRWTTDGEELKNG